ncbi:MAG: PIN domain-containing protein [Acetobacteraceae bacterium]
MILVDTSIWIDHLRVGDGTLARLLSDGRVLGHPFVLGELAVGNLRQRDLVLTDMRDLPLATLATDWETLEFIGRHSLFARGISYVDAHLLASVRLTPSAALWTRDRRLHDAADRLGVAMRPDTRNPVHRCPGECWGS